MSQHNTVLAEELKNRWTAVPYRCTGWILPDPNEEKQSMLAAWIHAAQEHTVLCHEAQERLKWIITINAHESI